MGELALPVGDGQEDGHDQGTDELEVVGIEAQLQHHLQHDVVDDGADADGEHPEGEVPEELAEENLADDDGGKADDDGHVHVRTALILGQKAAGEGHEAVGEGETQDDVGVGVDALGTGHAGVRAGGPDGAALLRAEEPVEKADDHRQDEKGQGQGVVEPQLPDIALGCQQVILIHADGLVGLAAHDPQVDGVEGQLGENAR